MYMCSPPSTSEDWVTYYKVWPDVSDYEKKEGDCNTANIGRHNTTVQGCAARCSDDDDCKGFVYGAGSIEKRCYLKREMCKNPETRYNVWTSYYKQEKDKPWYSFLGLFC